MKTREKDIEEIMTGFHTLKRYMLGQMKQSDLTQSQWMTLGAIRNKEGSSIKQIAEILGVSSSAATQLVDDLEQKGFVTRATSKDDGRVLILSLTPKALQQFTEMHREKIHTFSLMFDALDDAEFAQYLALNKKITARIQSL